MRRRGSRLINFGRVFRRRMAFDVVQEMESPDSTPRARVRPRAISQIDCALRAIGAIFCGYLAVRICISDFIPFTSKLATVPLNLFLAFGFIRYERKFFAGIAILMVVMISTQAYFTNKAIANSQLISIPDHPWNVYVRSIVPHLLILVCAILLYLRCPRREQEAQQVGSSNGG
jgi:hypothetical protein